MSVDKSVNGHFLCKLQFVSACLNAIGYRFVGRRRGYFFAASLNDPPVIVRTVLVTCAGQAGGAYV
ncbi:hypothetical protein, partial [Selenomonas ruminantium]|uniref:hypothetical protein n=1 Tax=Selenomonas ruminantium TaxID=971 RepID=UPI001C40A3BE